MGLIAAECQIANVRRVVYLILGFSRNEEMKDEGYAACKENH
jgi:hypothetical protein